MCVFHRFNILLFVLLVDQDVQAVKKDEGEVVIGNRVDHLNGNLQINVIILLHTSYLSRAGVNFFGCNAKNWQFTV